MIGLLRPKGPMGAALGVTSEGGKATQSNIYRAALERGNASARIIVLKITRLAY